MGYAHSDRTGVLPESFIYQTALPLWRSAEAALVAPIAVDRPRPEYRVCGARTVGADRPYLFLAGTIRKPSRCSREEGTVRQFIESLSGAFFAAERV